MNDEIELKLEVPPDATERLITDGPWLASADGRSERRLTIYYDTPESGLRKSGYTLRVRKIGERFVQTLRSLGGGGALFDRGEWEWPIDGPEPELAHLEDTPVSDVSLAGLEPVIRSEVERTSWRVGHSDSEIEFDVDIGTVRAAAREMLVSEVELELIKGQPSAAVELAQQIAEEVPVKLAVMSKAERGFALADGKLSQPTKAERVNVHRRMTIADGFETIVSACLRQFRLNEPLVVESRNVEAFHQARVAMRRLRSALTLFKPVVNGREFKRIEEGLGWFAAELGDARNFDVHLERDLSPEQRRFVKARREDAYDLAIAAIESARFRRLVLDLVGWAATGQWRRHKRADKPLDRFVNRRIDKLWSKASSSSPVSELDDHQRHRLRIGMKKLRYALEFTEALHTRKPHRRKRFSKTLEELQESLGLLHDLVVCRSLVTLDSWIAAPRRSAQGERRLVGDADRAMRRLHKIKPYWG